MKTSIIREAGFEEAMLGLSLSYNSDYDGAYDGAYDVAKRLAFKGDGHNKFLESIAVWIDIDVPREFWQQFDTYRVGVTKQSESTMHTICKRPLTQDDFEHHVLAPYMRHLNELIRRGNWEKVKHDLPESFLQRRIVCTNYMALQRIIRQRYNHKLTEWQDFCDDVLAQCKHPEFLQEAE